MTRSSSEFLVYACTSCGKRIFTDRHHTGRKGTCPVCGAAHEIGSRDPSVAAEPGVERRRSRRARAKGARVGLGKRGGETLAPADLHELHDLSATGLGFLVPGDSGRGLRPGQPDPRSLQGTRPPALRVGDVLQVTLHVPESGRPRTFKAEVRRVVREGREWLVGAQFLFSSPDEQGELRALVSQLS